MTSAKQNAKGKFRLIRNLSITKKLGAILALFVLFLFITMALSILTVELVSTVKAYVNGEAIFSKAQKDATYYLISYLNTQNEYEYEHFKKSLGVPLADRIARLEMEKENADLNIAYQALIKGGNHQNDVKNIARLFRLLRDVSYVDEAIKNWAAGDEPLLELKSIGEQLHEKVSTGQLGEKERAEFLARIDALNRELMVLEYNFSESIGELARWSKRLLLRFLYISFIISLFIAMLTFLYISNDIRRKILILHQGTEKIANGDYKTKVDIDTSDELGGLADAFNIMCENILTIQSRLEEKNHDLLKAQDDLKKSRDKALEVSRLKSEFLSNMSHEIRTPLNGVIGMIGLLSEMDLSSEQKEYLAMAESSAETLLSVINDILDFSKIEAGRLSVEKIEFNLLRTVEQTSDIIAQRAHEKGLELHFHVKPDVPTALIGDPTRLRQILINLLGNAVKFTQQGDILLSVEAISSTDEKINLRFSVKDTGIGIEQDKLNRIFESFSQADGSVTRKYGGTGLGLAITKSLVEMMKGEITVESEPGKGTIFAFTIPFPLAAQRSWRVSEEEFQLDGKNVMIVDDNATNRTILRDMCLSWGMNISIAISGPEALEQMRKGRLQNKNFDFILLDRLMPEMDGFDAAEKIRKEFGTEGITIMMLTSAGNRGDAKRCQEVGIDVYLLKPIKQSDLFDAFMNVVGQAKSETAEKTLITRHSIQEEKLRVKILLAEDNPTNQKLALAVLRKKGAKVATAQNGREAVEMVKKGNFDLVLMDIQMPEMDGLDATRIIREAEKETGTHIPIIAMTAHAMEGDREKCLDAGMDDYVPKPIKQETLFAAIDKAVSDLKGSQPETAKDSKTDAPVQIDEIMELIGGDREMVAELLSDFRNDLKDYFASMGEAFEKEDYESLNKLAHTVKGASGNMRATNLSRIALEMEEAAQGKDYGSVSELLKEIDLEIDKVSRFIDGEFDK